MYKQVLDPVAHSLGWSSLFAMLPLLVLFVLLGVVRMKAQWAALISLGVAILVARDRLLDAGRPGRSTAALEGAAFGFFPIMWIVINAIWIYNMTVATGHFAVLRRSFAAVSDDQRIQAVDHRVLLRRAARGAGRLRHAGRDHRRDADGARASADQGRRGRAGRQHRAGRVRRDRDPDHHARPGDRACPTHDLGAMVGRQTPFLALFVPLILVFMVDGRRGVRETWPAALRRRLVVRGRAVRHARTTSRCELTDIVASLARRPRWSRCCGSGRPRRPRSPATAAGARSRPRSPAERPPTRRSSGETLRRRAARTPTRAAEMLQAYAPYVIIIVIFALASLHPSRTARQGARSEFSWPGLNVLNAQGQGARPARRSSSTGSPPPARCC